MRSKLICKLPSFWHPAEIGVHKVLGKTMVQTSAYADSWGRVKFLLWPVSGSDYVTDAALELPDLMRRTELFSKDHFLKAAFIQRACQGELGRLGGQCQRGPRKRGEHRVMLGIEESGIIVNFLGVNQN